MSQNIKVLINYGERNVIISNRDDLLTADVRTLCELYKRAFPDTYLLNRHRIPQPVVVTSPELVPQWFRFAIAELEEGNEWGDFPHVALESRNCAIEMVPFTMC